MTETRSPRISALDFTKGALVLLMVLYHWLNYFFSTQGDIYRYLRFITPSFIFITGFIVSNIYLSKYEVTDPRLSKRLVERGLKVLGIFVFLNVLISMLLPNSYDGRVVFFSVRNLFAVFVAGNTTVAGTGKAAIFYILVPISYLLLISALLLVAARVFRHVFYLVCVLSFLSILVLRSNGIESGNLELVTIGLLGIIVGYLPIGEISRCVRHPLTLAVAYAGYLVAITIWNVIYPLQVIGVCLSLMVLYLIGDTSNEQGLAKQHVVLLGKYSLFGYIAQIAILQLLYRGLRYANWTNAAITMVVSFIAAFALTILSVELMDRVRSRSTAIDGIYRLVFS